MSAASRGLYRRSNRLPVRQFVSDYEIETAWNNALCQDGRRTDIIAKRERRRVTPPKEGTDL